jgi:protein gp37
MAKNSKIEWTEHTVNLWWGCSKVHTGCKNCYAEFLSDTRYKNNLWGENGGRKLIKSAFPDLLKYQIDAEKNNELVRVFIGSMMDIFENTKKLEENKEGIECTHDLRQRLFTNILKGWYPNIIFLLLTKRPENIMSQLPIKWIMDSVPKNVWFGTSVSDQKTADIWIKRLKENTPDDSNLFLSVEPQVGSIDSICLHGIKWVIQGGESGSNKREFKLDWAYKMREMCKEQKVPYFFKQIDKVQEIPEELMIRELPIFEWQNNILKNVFSIPSWCD